MIENTIGEAVGNVLDRVSSGVSAIVSDNDILRVCRLIVGKRQVSARDLSVSLSWTPEKVTSALDKMYASSLLDAAFGSCGRYSVNSERVSSYVDDHKDVVIEEVIVEHQKNSSVPEGVIAEDFRKAAECVVDTKRASTAFLQRQFGWGYAHAAKILDLLASRGVISSPNGQGPRTVLMERMQVLSLLGEEEAPRAKFSAPLAGIVSKPAKKVRKSSSESLDDMLKSIESMPKKHVFEGEEREQKICETFARLVDVVEKLNQGLEALDKVSEKVHFSRTLASIQRILPETEDGLGGVVITYRDYVLRGDWDPELTQRWCDQKVERVAAWTRDKLSHAITVAKRG